MPKAPTTFIKRNFAALALGTCLLGASLLSTQELMAAGDDGCADVNCASGGNDLCQLPTYNCDLCHPEDKLCAKIPT
jgi:hypothetical protein